MSIMHSGNHCLAVMSLFMCLLPGNIANARDADYDSCNSYLPGPRKAGDTLVGPESCLMHEIEFRFNDRDYVRVDMGLNGTAEGYVTLQGAYHEYLTNGPDLIFPQSGNVSERHLAVAQYERNRGSGILLVYPKSRQDWNGKMWVTAHGRGRSFRNGSMKLWHAYLNPADPLAAFDKIDKVMLAKGYALAVTLRTSEEGIGEVIATLDNGTVVDWAAFNDNAAIIKDFTAVASTAVKKRLGKEPSRTYLYGHSAGARIGRSINYTPGLNADANGKLVFDGFLMDDSATGLWLPVVIKDGKDVLLISEEDKQAFRPQIELVHQLYTKVWVRSDETNRLDWMSESYLANKRNNAKILTDKGLGSKFRMYEIRSISHLGGESLADGRRGKVRILDISLLIDGAVNLLDALVEGTADPVPSHSDWDHFGDLNRDGVFEYPAIAFPEVACPLGVFYPYPENGAYETAFAGFTGNSLEPLDEKQVFVDMNRNGIWDNRESVTAAWRRLGLLAPAEEFNREKYVSCIRDTTGKLRQAGFFSDATVSRYIKEAGSRDLRTSSLEN